MTEYSAEKLEQILNRRPEWAGFVASMVDSEGDEYFVITFTSPVQRQASIEVVSEDDELSVYWGDWHTHIELFQAEHDVDCLLELLESIFKEIVASVCYYRNGEDGDRAWAGSDLVPIKELGPTEDGHECVTASWLGTYSKVVNLRHG